MSLLELQRKHPKIYAQAFKRGALCERGITEGAKDVERFKPLFYGHPRHASMILDDLFLLSEVS